MFQDEIRLSVRGGRGGDGCIAFLREKYRPKGGPCGGDGGSGGSVFFEASAEVHGFHDLRGRRHIRAANGGPGQGRNRHGKDAPDLIVHVPAGTELRDAKSGIQLRDLVTPGDGVRIVRGGRGGKGNARFRTSQRQTPREAEQGLEGEERDVVLSLKLIADAGLVGLPNAGKSTLLARMSRSKTRSAGFRFTTLGPHLGVVELDPATRVTFADLPGLIEGAHEGRGLGDKFLKHVERTRLLVHVVAHDPTGSSPPPDEAYATIRDELEKYSPELAAKPELVILSKCDLPDWRDSLNLLSPLADSEVTPVSAVSGLGLDALLRRVVRSLDPEADEY